MEGAKELIELANKALPGAWDAVVRQIYIYGAGSMIVAVITGVIAITLFLKLNAGDPNEINDLDSVMIGFMIGAGITFLVFLILGVLYLINPEYWAIRMLKP